MVPIPGRGNVTSQGVIKTADGITAEWLGSVLGAQGLELVGVEAIGTGQMSKSYRVSYRRPRGERESVVVKLAATDQNSRDVGVNLGAYLREVTFYRELRDRIDGAGTLAEWHLAEQDPEEGWFTLVLEDIEDGVQGDQIAGCGPDRGANCDGGLGEDPRAGVRRPRARRDRVAKPAEPAQPGTVDRAAAQLPRALSGPDRPRACRGL